MCRFKNIFEQLLENCSGTALLNIVRVCIQMCVNVAQKSGTLTALCDGCLFSWSWRWWVSPAPGQREERRRDGGGPQVTVTRLTHVTGLTELLTRHRHLLIAAAGAENIPTVPRGPRDRERVCEQLKLLMLLLNKTTSVSLYYIYTSSQSFLNSKIWNVFSRSLFCSSSLHLFDTKYSKRSNIVKYFYYLK